MKTAGATLLAVLIAVRPSVLTAQTIGAIHDAMAREAHRVALSADQGADDEWAEVRALKPGTKLVITTRGSPPRPILFGRADESHVVVFALSKLGPEETIDRRNLVQINEVI